MKYFLLLMVISCTPSPQPTDDYVLVEFASKLEEDYLKNGGNVLTRKEVAP
ncbi:MAG TPA: hypothetical protein VNJ08_15565 [Bacteriovoracaceae bacterium]|nr:hypothetical protein [Bacteriovoracaceae bacterium]